MSLLLTQNTKHKTQNTNKTTTKKGFLTAVKQEVSRRHAADKWALDDVVMSSEVTHPPREGLDALREAPAEGVYVYGLFLDGAAWSGKENKCVAFFWEGGLFDCV